MAANATPKRPARFHIFVFLAPALAVYAAVMIFPLLATLSQSFFSNSESFVGLRNYFALISDPRLSASFWNAFRNNVWFFAIHMCVQTPLGILLAALLSNPRLRLRGFYRTVFFIPAILSFVIVGFVWRLILSPTWGVAQGMLKSVGLGSLFQPWLGKEDYALTTLALISVWQFVGTTMLLIYAALLAIPDEVIEAAECDGITGWAQFRRIQLPLALPTIGICSILIFIGNFNAFDLVYVTQGPAAGPAFSTDLLGVLMFRTLYGYGVQLGDRSTGATIATVMFLIILAGVCLYLFLVQRRLRRYQF
jgi:raffinose/stachyose/melibiose transport system permease protein